MQKEAATDREGGNQAPHLQGPVPTALTPDASAAHLLGMRQRWLLWARGTVPFSDSIQAQSQFTSQPCPHCVVLCMQAGLWASLSLSVKWECFSLGVDVKTVRLTCETSALCEWVPRLTTCHPLFSGLGRVACGPGVGRALPTKRGALWALVSGLGEKAFSSPGPCLVRPVCPGFLKAHHGHTQQKLEGWGGGNACMGY